MREIRIVNDGKGKNQSWEAWFEPDALNIVLAGYGADEKEARLNLRREILRAIEMLEAGAYDALHA